ncbi:MAG: hypothetical protein ACREFQ_08805, partial [Stellaceae bacterium]
LLGLIAPLLAAGPIARQLPPAEPTAMAHGPGPAAGAALAAAVLFGFFASALALDRSRLAPRPDVAPRAALAAARNAGLTGHVFNSVRFGGYLMIEGVPSFIDGRADLFGDDFLKRYVAATSAVGDNLPYLLSHYAVEWTLLEPSSPAVTLLDHLPGWRRLYTDRYAVIHRRTPPDRCAPRRRRHSGAKIFLRAGPPPPIDSPPGRTAYWQEGR